MVYAPGTEETDPKKQNMSLQQNAAANLTNAANITTNTTNIATNTANIATNTTNIATNTTNIATNTTNIATNTTNIATNTTDIAGIKAAWTSYTPTCTSSSGTITSVSATGRYKQIGKTVFLNVTVTITTAGTGAGQLLVPLPVNAQGSNGQALSVVENAVSGVGATGTIATSNATRVVIVKYDGTTYITSGAVFYISGVYESA